MPADANQGDDVLRSARREALVVLVIWLLAMSYTVGFCVWHGYGSGADVAFVVGFPSWVFWGIICPWLVCVVVSWWFAYWFMTDESLGDASTGEMGASADEGPGDGG